VDNDKQAFDTLREPLEGYWYLTIRICAEISSGEPSAQVAQGGKKTKKERGGKGEKRGKRTKVHRQRYRKSRSFNGRAGSGRDRDKGLNFIGRGGKTR